MDKLEYEELKNRVNKHMLLLTEVLTEVTTNAPHFPLAATLALVGGFLAAITIGSIAWYNSKRPVGWEAKERPDFVPEVDKSDFIANTDD
ncbi:MAG: hypothetical protein RLZZ74_1675 [Cyanobacteriota bacterium]